MTNWTKIPDLGNIDRYLRAIDEFPLLTLEEEQEASCKKDSDKLILSHLRLAASLARKQYMMNMAMSLTDMISEANLALVQAAQNFNAEQGRFSSFAQMYIHSALLLHVMDNSQIVRLVTTKNQRKLFNNLRGKKKVFLSGSNRTQLTDDEVKQIADELEVKPHEVREMDGRLSHKDQSLNELFLDQKEVTELFADSRYDPVNILEKTETWWLEQFGVEEALSILDDRKQFIIRNRLLVDKPLTLHEIGTIFGISFERVRQLEKAALKALREHFKEYV